MPKVAQHMFYDQCDVFSQTLMAVAPHHPHVAAVQRSTLQSSVHRLKLLAHQLPAYRQRNQNYRRLFAASATSEQGSKARTVKTPWQIYNGRMPLVGLEPIANVLKGTPLQQLLQMHTYTLLEGPDQVWYFDFLPLRPTSPATALLLLTASSAPGEVRVKKLEARSVKPNESVRLVGSSLQEDPLTAAREYNRRYNTELHLLKNNCKHHTSGLTQFLLQRQ